MHKTLASLGASYIYISQQSLSLSLTQYLSICQPNQQYSFKRKQKRSHKSQHAAKNPPSRSSSRHSSSKHYCSKQSKHTNTRKQLERQRKTGKKTRYKACFVTYKQNKGKTKTTFDSSRTGSALSQATTQTYKLTELREEEKRRRKKNTVRARPWNRQKNV